jgi:hypothetical protein
MAATVVIGTGMVLSMVVAAALLGHLDWMLRIGTRFLDRYAPRPATTDNLSIEQLAADLRRLAAHLERCYRADQPAKMERLAAAALAYDWVLLSACRTLDVPVPGDPPLAAFDRLQAEAALAAQGLDWS